MSLNHTGASVTDNEEHRSVTGVNAKAVLPYVFSGNNTNPVPMGGGLLGEAFDSITMSNPDGNTPPNYQTWTIKSGVTTVATLTLTYDGNNKITSIVRS